MENQIFWKTIEDGFGWIFGVNLKKLVDFFDLRGFSLIFGIKRGLEWLKCRLETKEALHRLLQYIKENRLSLRGRDRMINLIESYLASHVARTLDQSLETFEKGINGERVRFASDDEGIQQMLELYKQNTEKEIENIFYKLLRNPK